MNEIGIIEESKRHFGKSYRKRGFCPSCGMSEHPKGNIFIKVYSSILGDLSIYWECMNCHQELKVKGT